MKHARLIKIINNNPSLTHTIKIFVDINLTLNDEINEDRWRDIQVDLRGTITKLASIVI